MKARTISSLGLVFRPALEITFSPLQAGASLQALNEPMCCKKKERKKNKKRKNASIRSQHLNYKDVGDM